MAKPAIPAPALITSFIAADDLGARFLADQPEPVRPAPPRRRARRTAMPRPNERGGDRVGGLARL